MNITYMIGNGFDIALGLKTRYSDFLKHYCGLDKTNNPVLVRFQDKIKNDKCNLWSCAEKAFGEFDWSDFDGVNTVKTFRECLLDFQHDFEIYLKNQWNRFVLPEGDNGREIASKFLEGMLRLDKFMGNRFAKEYQQSVLRPRTNLRFIVFNYTDMLEQMWNSILPQQGNEFHFFEAIANNTRFSVDVSQPCFVHGVLSRSKYLFGVDNSIQVKDKVIKDECERTGTLIKPYMDVDSGLGYDETANALIESSDMIVTFGLSFGLTDRIWWERLYQHVFGRGRQLVVCPYYDRKHPVMNSGDAVVLDKQNALRKIFSSLNDNQNYKFDFSRNRIRNVLLLDDFEKDVGDGKKTRCDYFGLYELGKATVKGESEVAQ